MGWNRHLNDDRLLDCYLGERGIEPVNFRSAEHLDECPTCHDRYAALVATLDEVRANAELETDRVFTPERLDVQKQLIARRVASINHAARVLAFPAQAQQSSATGLRFAPRWLAAAAAAGLFVGGGVGVFFDAQARGFRPAIATATPATSSPSATTPAAPAASAAPATTKPEAQSVAPAATVSEPDDSDDSAFMSELQMAFERPGTRELLAYDALTPHVRDLSFTPR